MAVSAKGIIGATEGLVLAFGIGAGVWYSSGVGHVSEAKYDETCVKNEAFSSQEVEEE